MAKAANENGSDGEGRKRGERTGLDRAFCEKALAKTSQEVPKDPGSPRCKRCPLDVASSSGRCGVVV